MRWFCVCRDRSPVWLEAVEENRISKADEVRFEVVTELAAEGKSAEEIAAVVRGFGL